MSWKILLNSSVEHWVDERGALCSPHRVTVGGRWHTPEKWEELRLADNRTTGTWKCKECERLRPDRLTVILQLPPDPDVADGWPEVGTVTTRDEEAVTRLQRRILAGTRKPAWLVLRRGGKTIAAGELTDRWPQGAALTYKASILKEARKLVAERHGEEEGKHVQEVADP